MKELIKYTKEMIAKYPRRQGEIEDLFQLCIDEIEQGGSEVHEIELCMDDIKQVCGDSNTSEILERLKNY